MNKLNFFFICGLLCAATMSLNAQTWNCGYPNAANVKATLDADGTLTISGTGAMRDYVYFTNLPPWNNVLTSIIAVIFTGNITNIGNNAFRGCTNLTSVDIGSVTQIGNSAFESCSSLTSVTIPGSVTQIGSGAFSSCSSLTSVTIPGSVTQIGSGAFSSCSSLTYVAIPNSVASIGILAFAGGTSLTSIDVAETNDYFSAENGILLNKDKTILIQYPCGKQGECIIPNSVKTIGDYAFSDFVALTSVTIPGNVEKIGDNAFDSCTGLSSVTISDGVKTIGYQAFWGCTALSELSIGNTVEEIGEGAFKYCNLSLVVIPDGVKYIKNQAFYHAYVTHLVIPSGVTEIEGNAFGENPLEEIWVSWHDPAEVTVFLYCFIGIDKSSVILHVPVGTKAAYEAVDVWKDFNIINDGLSFNFLSNLTVNVGELSPVFRSSTFSYRVSVPQSIESILLTATPFEKDATVTGDGLKQLITGENTFEITVVTPAGNRVYTVIVTRRTKDLNLDFVRSNEIESGVTMVERYNGILGRNEWVPVIDRYELVYVLTTGNFSGNLTLLFDIRGNIYSKEVSVDAFNSYRFFLRWRVGDYAPGDISFFTHFDAYGRPSYINTNYRRRSCNVKVFDNNDELSNESIDMIGNSISEISVSGLYLIEGEVTTSYSVTFDSQGGSAVPTQTIEDGSFVIKPVDPVREGYDFAGWFTDNGTFLNEWDFDNDIVTKDITLYAKWELSTGTVRVESPTVKVYPNPVKDELRIESNGLTIKSVEIFGLSGKTVYQSSNFSNPINVSVLSQGIYFLKIETEKGVIARKFVKE